MWMIFVQKKKSILCFKEYRSSDSDVSPSG